MSLINSVSALFRRNYIFFSFFGCWGVIMIEDVMKMECLGTVWQVLIRESIIINEENILKILFFPSLNDCLCSNPSQLTIVFSDITIARIYFLCVHSNAFAIIMFQASIYSHCVANFFNQHLKMALRRDNYVNYKVLHQYTQSPGINH